MAAINAIDITSLTFQEGSVPSTPAATKWKVYTKTTGLFVVDDAGTETGPLGAAGGNVATDAIWAAAGDLVQGTGASTSAKLASGAIKKVLTAAGVGTAVAWAYPPGYEYDYVEYTSGGIAVTATTEAGADTIVTGTGVAYDGSTTIMVQFYSPGIRPQTGGAATITIVLYDGASSIGKMGAVAGPTANNTTAVFMTCRLTPSSATHTYSIRAFVSSGSGNVDNGAGGSGASMPLYIRQVKV